jgi:HPt (histidine-containing phosphotransfer) domain-containing protein
MATAAGARTFLMKPFTLAALRAALSDGPAALNDVAALAASDFDPSSLLDAAGGDRSVLTRFVDVFLRDAEAHVSAVLGARERGDRDVERRRMHQLVGAAGMVGARRLSAMARALESAQPDAPTLDDLRAELAAVGRSLRSLANR